MKSKQEQIDEMKKNIETLLKNLEAIEKSEEKVEFLRGGFTIEANGFVGKVVNRGWSGNSRALTFATKEIAEKVDKITQQSYKIAQYVFQKEPDYALDWNNPLEEKCSIFYSYASRAYDYSMGTIFEELGTVYMPEHVAKQLVEDLNNGNYSID